MSAGKTLTRLTEQLYAAHWILAALQKRPRSFAGVTLYANEAHTLRIIAQNEGISQTEISALTLRTKGATSAMVDKLVEKKLVYRQRERGDQRRYLLMLAPLGRQVYEELVRRAETYASAANAYGGQIITAKVDDTYKAYILQPSEGGYQLKEVGANPSDVKQYVVVGTRPGSGQEQGVIYIDNNLIYAII